MANAIKLEVRTVQWILSGVFTIALILGGTWVRTTAAEEAKQIVNRHSDIAQRRLDKVEEKAEHNDTKIQLLEKDIEYMKTTVGANRRILEAVARQVGAQVALAPAEPL